MFCIVNKSEEAFTSCSRDRREGKDNCFVLFHKTFDSGVIYLIIRTEDPNLGINHSKTFMYQQRECSLHFLLPFLALKLT